MTQPAAVAEAADVVIQAFRDVQERLELEQALILTDPAKARRLTRINTILATIEAELLAVEANAGVWVADQLPTIYQLGADTGGIGFQFNQFHRQAVAQLQQDLYNDVLAATDYMRDDAKRWIRETARRLAAEGHIEGVAPRKLALRFAELAPRAATEAGFPLPITAVAYSDGTLRTIDDYADMLFRTKAAEAHNVGTLNRARELGFTAFRIRDGSDCGLTSHDDGTTANGMIVDDATAVSFLLSHPRCRRSFQAVNDPSLTPVDPPAGVTAPEPIPTRVEVPSIARPARQARQVRSVRTPRLPSIPPVPPPSEDS